MKTISLHVDPNEYERLKERAAAEGRSAASLVREAMARYLDEHTAEHSIADLEPHDCGRVLRGWTREEVWDEITDDVV